MRYQASEKLEIIHTVERSHLSARQTLDKIGIPRPTFYRWYDNQQWQTDFTYFKIMGWDGIIYQLF